MVYSEQIKRIAVCVGNDGTPKSLSRIPSDDKSYDEEWIQQLLEKCPALLRSEEIGFDCAELVCIGREVSVSSAGGAGFIDNLYVSSSGKVVIVETKLFRNQESRRTVIAQILDYAKEAAKWDAEVLDSIAEAYTFKKRKQSFQVVDLMYEAGYLKIADSAAFVDSVNRNLKAGNFLLLIVGDGIRTGVQELADFLSSYTSLGFQLGLIALEMYRHEDSTIVIPNILTKTTVIERQIFQRGTAQLSTASTNEKGQPKAIRSKEEFIHDFALAGKCDEARAAEFIQQLNNIPNVVITSHPTQLRVRVVSPDGSTFPILNLCLSSNGSDASIILLPVETFSDLKKANLPTEVVDSYFDFYKAFISSRCKHVPYENISGFYYGDINKILGSTPLFVEAIEKLVSDVYSLEE